jgi:hypothetical protein
LHDHQAQCVFDHPARDELTSYREKNIGIV